MTDAGRLKISVALKAAWAAGKFAAVDFGSRPGRKGCVHTPETKRILSEKSKGHPAWNKGLSAATEPRLRNTGPAKTPEKEAIRRRKISEFALVNGYGGYKPNSGRSKKGWHESPIAGRVFLQSSYETRYAKVLDAAGIQWERNLRAFEYEFEGVPGRYIPDFFLPLTGEYIEVKGYETARDHAKWKHFPGRLVVIKDADIIRLENMRA